MTIFLLEPLISSKDKEENLVAGEKNSLHQLWRPRDRAIFGIPFVIESSMPKPSFPLIMIKRLFIYEILFGQLLDLIYMSTFRNICQNFGIYVHISEYMSTFSSKCPHFRKYVHLMKSVSYTHLTLPTSYSV